MKKQKEKHNPQRPRGGPPRSPGSRAPVPSSNGFSKVWWIYLLILVLGTGLYAFYKHGGNSTVGVNQPPLPDSTQTQSGSNGAVASHEAGLGGSRLGFFDI